MNQLPARLKQMLAYPPPRPVDEAVFKAAVAVFFPAPLRILLYVLPVLAVIVCAATMVVVVRLGDMTGEWQLFRTTPAQTTGTVLKVEKQRKAKGGELITYLFSFEDGQGRTIRAVSFTDRPIAVAGDRTIVEYVADNPGVARIKGSRTTPVPVWALAAILGVSLIVVVMPMVMVGWRRRWVRRLLEQGVKAQALVEKIKKGPKGSRVAVLRFALQGVSCQANVQVQPWGGGLAKVEASHAAANPLSVLVHPQKPRQVMVLDLL